ncbi:MAG: hypothetical protein ACKVVT_11145 [Dehalococcoidia bacterium]
MTGKSRSILLLVSVLGAVSALVVLALAVGREPAQAQAPLPRRALVPALAVSRGPDAFDVTVRQGVAQQDGALVGDALWFAWSYLNATLGRATTTPVVVTVGASPGICGTAAAVASLGRLCIDLSAAGWSTVPEFFRRKVVVHEHVHNLQAEVGCFAPRAPLWFTEGAAEYLAFEAVIAAGLVTRAGVESNDRTTVRGRTSVAGLADYETRSQIAQEPTFSLFRQAAKLLVERSGVGSLLELCAQSVTADWKTAFARIYNRSVDQFYVDFAAHVAALRQ